jgi:uncharacterized protein (DUF1697 family)
MRTFIALLRGINVGGRNKLPMTELRSLMESVGLENISTYIQSGNVVFQAPCSVDSDFAVEVEGAIEERHGFRPEVTLLDSVAFGEAISENPFPEGESDPKSLHLVFLSVISPSPDFDALESLRQPSERFELKGKVFYLHAPDGIGRSKLAARIERSLGVSGTSRNWRTVLKLQEMIQRCENGA